MSKTKFKVTYKNAVGEAEIRYNICPYCLNAYVSTQECKCLLHRNILEAEIAEEERLTLRGSYIRVPNWILPVEPATTYPWDPHPLGGSECPEPTNPNCGCRSCLALQGALENFD